MFFLYINISILDNSHCLKLNKGCDVLCLLPLLLRSDLLTIKSLAYSTYLMIMSGNLIQSESLDTSIDNANICHTAENSDTPIVSNGGVLQQAGLIGTTRQPVVSHYRIGVIACYESFTVNLLLNCDKAELTNQFL